MLGEQRERLGVEGDLAALPGLGLLLPHAGLGLRVAAVHPEDRPVEVDVAPSQSRDLAPPRAGDHGQPEQQAHSGSAQAVLSSAAASSALGGPARCAVGTAPRPSLPC